MKWILYSMLLITGLCGYNSAGAQTIHPVTASLQLVPPYSVYLADYAAPGNDKLRVILTLNDLSQPSYSVRLRLKVELNGRVIMQTDPAYRPSGITILPGMPQIVTGTQLNEYLVSDHLQFLNGFSRDNYERTKALPEGAYRICVTAYDYNRSDNVAISNEGCNIFFFQKKEAPLLNYPLCNSRVDRKDPQFLTFNWSIRNTPSFVTGSMGTGYRFELFEVRPAGSNPEYIVRSSTPVYTTTTDAAMLVYGPGEPRLMDSMQYVWRVQAFDKDGRDAYQNNGYSLACTFTYGGVDPFVMNNIGKAELLGEALGERSGKWWWHINTAQPIEGWNIQYRKQAATDAKDDVHDWIKQHVTDTLLHLFKLEPDNTYEAKVQPVIKGINGFWSETVVFRTMPKRVFECGKNDTAGSAAAAASEPLNSAVAGMIIRVGDFDMQLLEVSGGNGRYSGYGAIATPLLGMRLNVKFKDVLINDRLQLTQGDVVALTDGIDAWIKDRTKVKNDVEVIKDWTETMPDFETDSLGEIKDFATELLGISDGVWEDTYVFTESERKDVQAALAEVKTAMQDLQDSDPSNDAAAEKKLRQTLKKAGPLLEKLSNNIGKGVLVQLGLTRKKLYKSIVASYVKELQTSVASLIIEQSAMNVLAHHGPNNEDEVRRFIAALPTCIRSLDQQKQKDLGGYLQKKINATAEWDKYAETLQGKIAKQQTDESFFGNTEKEIDEAGKNKAGLTIEDWATENTSKWNDAYERMCTYVLEVFEAEQVQMAYVNTLSQEAADYFSNFSLPSGIYVFDYGTQIQFAPGRVITNPTSRSVEIDGKKYIALFAVTDHTFRGFYNADRLLKVPKNSDGNYSTDSLNKYDLIPNKGGWILEGDGNFKVIVQLKQTYVQEFFEDLMKSKRTTRETALEIAKILDQVNDAVYQEYLKKAWEDRTSQERGLYEIGFSLASVEEFKKDLEEFIRVIQSKVAGLSSLSQKWYTTTVSKDKDKIRERIIKWVLWTFEDKDYLALKNLQRDSVLRILTDGNLHSWNLGDQIAMKLVTRVDDKQQKAWLEILSTGSRLKKLFGCVDGDEFDEMIAWLSTTVTKEFKRPQDLTPESAILAGRYLPFKEGLFTGYVVEKWVDDEGNINLSTRPQFTFDKDNAYKIKATDWVIIHFKSPFKFNDKIKFSKGSKVPMPALLAYALFNEENNRRLIQGGKFALDVALLAIGVGEITAAMQAATKLEKVVRITKAIVDLGMGLGDIVINDVLAPKLAETKEGQEFLDTWNTVQLYYGLGSIGAELGMYINKLYKQGQIWNEMEKGMAEEMNKVMKDVEQQTGMVNHIDDLDNVEAGWKFWSEYPKKVINGEEFAVVGKRYYSEEAVDVMAPVGFGAGKSGKVGQGVSTRTVEGVIQTEKEIADGAKSYFDNFDVIVVTEEKGSKVRAVHKISKREVADAKLGLKNGFTATSEEVEVAKARIKQYKGDAGNYAYMTGKVDGLDADVKNVWPSGPVLPGEPQIFEAIEVAGKDGKLFLRNVDSEYKMLNWFASKLKPGAIKGKVYTELSGELKIISEHPYCQSCRGIIKQFNDMFPNIKLVLVNGAK